MNYKYEVALSFAGENREFAEAVAAGLREEGVNVFYDDFFADELWGEDLSVRLRNVYHDSSQFCIILISEQYMEKMWPSFERQQAIERMMRQRGKAYILPVRLDGYSGDVPGLSGLISYLSVSSSEPEKVVNAFLGKIGKESVTVKEPPARGKKNNAYIPKLKRGITDKEKNQFLKASFGEIVNLMEHFASETKKEYPHFDYDAERVTSRKAVFTLYENEKQATQFKIWIGGMLGSNSISVSHGNHIDIENDSSMNESISIEESDGELKLKAMGFGMFGAEKDRLMTPSEAAEYLWKMACQSLS